MDEDIDIEEHDLLENPAIRKIFPDLSILKEEISGYCDEATEVQPDLKGLNIPGSSNTYSGVALDNCKEICITDEHSDSESEIIFVDRRQPPLYGNKIILGSKPVVQCKVEKDSEKIMQKMYSSTVNLEDISTYLKNNEKFCRICNILFFRIESLKSHNNIYHRNRYAELQSNGESVKSTYKCDKCPKEFTYHGYLVKHIRCVHRHNFRSSLFKSDKGMDKIPRSGRSIYKMVDYKENKCFHCNKQFSTKKLLIDHIYVVLRANKEISKGSLKVLTPITRNKSQKALRSIKNKNNCKIGIKHNTNSVNNILGPSLFYRCLYCSYYFTHINFYQKHIINKHKDKQAAKVKLESFDAQCKFCYLKSTNFKSYNAHLLIYHKEKVNNIHKINLKIVIPKLNSDQIVTDHTKKRYGSGVVIPLKYANMSYEDSNNEDVMDCMASNYKDDKISMKNKYDKNTYVLKSILFKCLRCDIIFLTAKSAIDHENHMEMLVNWKCHICQKIFKKDDEFTHGNQHQFCCKFTVIELNASELKRVLYKCSKCAIHFSEDYYLPHYETCERVVAESVYCKFCDFLIDTHSARHHFEEHKFKKLEPMDFTIIYSDIIVLKSGENENVNLHNETDIRNTREVKLCSTDRNTTPISYFPSSDTKKTGVKKHRINYNRDLFLKLKYCEVCKTFVTQGLIETVHLESRCAHINTIVCEYCGLVFGPNSMRGHRRQHQKIKDLKLRDFKFYDVRSRKKIIPPVPQYPKCNICEVHFISKATLRYHVCSDDENAFLTCQICNTKLSELVFKLHMSFHYYSKTNLQSFITNEYNKSRIKTKCSLPVLYSEATKDLEIILNSNAVESETTITSQRKLMHKNGINIFSNASPEAYGISHIKSVHKNQDLSNRTGISKNNNAVHMTQKQMFVHISNFELKSDYELFGIIYFCSNCLTYIDAYDRVVEHCQDHLCGINIETESCETCKMTLERRSIHHHMRIHHSKENQREAKKITFDLFYFILDNLWIKHIFETVSENQIQMILNRSMYKTNKIKMRVIQEGLPGLTVYKCSSCCSIVDCDTLEKHAETSCFKIRKYPCRVCGLPFLSYLEQQKHQAIHQERNISLKSYKIVGFNQENDKGYNKILNRKNNYFFLYECRKCNGVIDKYQRSSHKCSSTDLKKCFSCNLLIPSSDFKSHISKHKAVSTFIQKNMRVVLFGQNYSAVFGVHSGNNDNSKLYFDGTFIDYTYYQCVDCEVCFDKSHIHSQNHNICYDSTMKLRCPKCDLFILKKKMTHHMTLHERCEDFVKENINVIPFSVSKLKANFITAEKYNSEYKTIGKSHPEIQEICNQDQDLRKHESKNNQNVIFVPESERTAKLFKCVCGLHFLEILSIKEHFVHCNPRASKQCCSKCNHQFTPKVLFDHLLMHHGDKKYNYSFIIVEMTKKKCDTVTLYKCTYCYTHYVDYKNAKAHFDICQKVNIAKEKCPKCNLYFDIGSIRQHKNDQHKKNVANIDVIDLKIRDPKDLDSKESQLQNSVLHNKIMESDFIIDLI